MKQRISVGARQNTPKNLSRNHYTTIGLGHVFPIYCEEFCNGSKVNMRVNNFSRVAPQFLPNLGRLDMKLHAFYVPFNLVWNHFEKFQLGLPSWNNNGSQIYKYCPTFNDCDLSTFFTITSLGLSEEVQPSANVPFDFLICDGQDVVHYFKFTPFGKYVYHVLNALGYNFTFVTYSSTTKDTVNTNYSALPLLSFFKLYLDYFIPSQLQPSSSLHRLFAWLHEQTATTLMSWYGYGSTDNSKQDFMNYIFEFLREMYYYYQNNYFTSAWMSPNSVVPGLNNIGSTSIDRPVINSIDSQANVNSNSVVNQQLVNSDNIVSRTLTPQASVGSVSGLVTQNSALTSDGISFMQKFARFIKRSNFVGSRSIERILGLFGVRITDFEGGMCKYLGSSSFTMNQADVTVTGSVEESGDYTGKGWFNTDDDRIFKCDCDLYGMFFVTASVEVPSTFVDGVRRRNMHIQPLDFYNPDMDGTVMQAIAGSELFHRNPFYSRETSNSITSNGLTPRTSFGYQLRYMEFKTAIDDVSGDFCVPTLNSSIDGFILPRRIYDMIAVHDHLQDGQNDDYDLSDFAYSPDLKNNNAMTPVVSIKGDDAYQFNRIFRQTDGSADPIFGVFRFDVVVSNCVLPANTSAELDGRGKELEFESNGVHV